MIKRRTFLAAGLGIALGVGAGWAWKRSRVRPGVAVKSVERGGVRFCVVEIDLGTAALGLYWKGKDGRVYGGFEELRKGLGRPLIFAANAGIFEPGYFPTGLHVEEGRELTPLNLKEGPGNFYMKPNGVFLIDQGGARIIESAQYRPTGVRLATQSGPILLAGGQINALFSQTSENRHVRSGIGVRSPRQVVFAISQAPVTFHDLASVLGGSGCGEAIYLDGSISQFSVEGKVVGGIGGGFAGMLAVVG
jgi:uncharacterized protein YigE (DUF2233 family)